MAIKRVLLAGRAAGALAGCVAPTHTENAALRMPWPEESPPALLAFQPPIHDYPTVGGDILRGTSPADQEAARAAAGAGGAPTGASAPASPQP